MSPVGRLHVLTDRFAVAASALRAGAPVVQVRVKGTPDRPVLELTRRVVDLAAAVGASVLVDDRVHVAVAAGADGAHVGADDLPVGDARRLLGPSRVLGATARDPLTARQHQADGATYLGVGPAYPTTTKGGLPDPLGPAGVAAVARAVEIPVIAIAGVTPDRVGELLDAGAHGVAVISAVGGAVDPAAATDAFLRALEREGAR
jgi:thiamine-phosphate pyrophosphorylase